MKLAFVFPGQGSQSIGMLSQLAEEFPLVQSTFNEASEVLGYDLWSLTQNGPEQELNLTHITQPALLAASVALFRVWQEQGGAVPTVLAGHSLGEYSALVCAGAIDFAAAIDLVAKRGKYMQQAVPEGVGSMAAIVGLDDETVNQICQQAADGEIVAAANYNSKGQVVIAGQTAAVARAVSLADDAGARMTKILAVSVPSHSIMMQPAAEQLAKQLDSIAINTPEIPVIHNVDVKSHQKPEDIKQALVAQLYSPVRWVETVEHMQQENIELIIECGPGKVLSGLIKRIDRSLTALPMHDPDTLSKALGAIK